MNTPRQIALHRFGDMCAVYLQTADSPQTGLLLLPASRLGDISLDKSYTSASLIEYKLIGDDHPFGFASGHTMRGSGSVAGMKFESQSVQQEEGATVVTTRFRNHREGVLEHELIWRGGQVLESRSRYRNEGGNPVTLEMISSFSLCGLTPFAAGDTPDTLLLHRLRSRWSEEARQCTETIEELQLERSWSGHSVNAIRYGQVGSMPVRGYFPFAAVEDRIHGVTWGAQLAHPASWQMEVHRKDDALSLSGGLADRELGHWLKTLEPGESFETPISILSVTEGGLDEITHRLTQWQELALARLPETEKELPVIFNEFCTTWGRPTAEHIGAIARTLKGRGIRYFVIDCGWYSEQGRSWEVSMGDWKPSPELFPNGLMEAVEQIRSNGMIPGIWFEMENAGTESDSFHKTEWLIQRDGIPVTSGSRRFWDFRKPEVIEHLSRKIIDFLKQYGFGYLKVDYNETIGIGCDGAESLGEGLREQMEAVQSFFRRIRDEVPGLVIENCSSGGHRLEPSMMALCSMASFSDAHECVEIPVVAANVHRAILPRQSQIWAVLRPTDSDGRLYYSLANGFLGRLCLSGDVERLTQHQWDIVESAISFYRRIAPCIKEGRSFRYGPALSSYRHPEGWQGIVRVSADGNKLFAVAHTFGGPVPHEIRLPLPEGKKYALKDGAFHEPDAVVRLEDNHLVIKLPRSFQALAVEVEAEL